MSVFEKIPEAVAGIKNFDSDIPLVTIEADNKIMVENYKTLRLFNADEINIDFEGFCVIIEGEGLIIKNFTPISINIFGKISKCSYLSRENR